MELADGHCSPAGVELLAKGRTGGSLVALAESGSVDVASLLESNESAVEITERREVADLVRRVLAELSADYAILLTSKYLDESTLEELAAHSASSVEATKSKLARARRAFHAAFETLVGSDQGARLL